MTDSAPTVHKLEKFFNRKSIARLDELRRALNSSGRTVFRVMGRMGYLSSYSHSGRYYTLEKIPSFDPDGLWEHAGVLFSRYGTLRATIVEVVSKALAGHTHAELQLRLRLRVHDTLHDLVEAGEVGRIEVERLYLYVSTEPTRAEAQLAERRRIATEPSPPARPLLDPSVVIEVLLGVIHSPRPDAAALAALLQAQGKAITLEQVEAVWAHHELGKKKPASRRLRQ
ncbi:MAG TPA: hypothetical protein VJK02_19545 [Anaerolineales bacterium]|nr:hypothetical protein [Anaerolineales bacterium]